MAEATICRVLAKIPVDENATSLYVSIMAFSSGLLMMLWLPGILPVPQTVRSAVAPAEISRLAAGRSSRRGIAAGPESGSGATSISFPDVNKRVEVVMLTVG